MDEGSSGAFVGRAGPVPTGPFTLSGDRREEAFAVPSEMMAQRMIDRTPNGVRFDPLCSRLKEDPRYDER